MVFGHVRTMAGPLPSMIARFFRDESGGALVDYVAITAATVVTGHFLFDEVSDATLGLARDLERQIASIEIKTSF
jgi:Flp pilus assembly pilin Flp